MQAEILHSALRYWRLRREQWLSAETLEQRQWTRFKLILQHAFDNSPFYRGRFQDAGITPADIKDRTDLPRIPVTTREDLRDPERLIASGYRVARMKRFLTSGSSGRVTTTYFDHRAWILGKFLLKIRARFACGVRPWDRIALFQETSEATAGIRRLVLRQRSFSILKPIPEILPELVRYAPTVLYGFPSYLLRLSEHAGQGISPALIFTSGEMLDLDTRKTIEGTFNAPVFDVYGCTELKEIAWQCRAQGGYHINSDWLIVEELGTNDGSELPPGRLVVTSLYNFGMPLIRYQLGDTGKLLDDSCSCGRGLPLMAPCLGRSVDYFTLPSGTLVSPYAMTCAVEVVKGLRQYQIVQEAPDRVVVNVVPLEGVNLASESRIQSTLAPILEGVTVTVRVVPKIERERSGKYRVVVSRLPVT